MIDEREAVIREMVYRATRCLEFFGLLRRSWQALVWLWPWEKV